MDENDCHSIITVPFRSSFHAEIVCKSLSVDEELSDTTTKSLKSDGNKLIVDLHAKDTSSLRVSCNAFLDLLVLVTKTIERFGDLPDPQS